MIWSRLKLTCSSGLPSRAEDLTSTRPGTFSTRSRMVVDTL